MADKDVHHMRIVGGHPALDLANTVDARRDRWGPDALTSYADLARWAERIGIQSPSETGNLIGAAEGAPHEAGKALNRARAGRELLYRIFLAEARGAAPETDDVVQLRILVAAAAGDRTLMLGKDGFAWQWNARHFETVLHRVAYAAAELLVDGSRRRIRECTGQNCGWLFLDRSKSGRRRWCSEAGCGTPERVRRKRRLESSQG